MAIIGAEVGAEVYLVGTDMITVSIDVIIQQMLLNIYMMIMKKLVLFSRFKDLKKIRHRE